MTDGNTPRCGVQVHHANWGIDNAHPHQRCCGGAARRGTWGGGPPAGGPGGGRLHRLGPPPPPPWGPGRGGGGSSKRLYKAPTDYTMPRKTIQSRDGSYKATKRLYKATKYQTKPQNLRQNPNILDKALTCLTRVATNSHKFNI